MTTTIDAENAKQIRRTMDVLITVQPESGDPIVINNENLIKAVVSLRSDLSIVDPTLPESELNVEAYFDDDISETLAEIPDDTPITYRAGYDSDLSPVRKFYLAEQITWKDNIMSIHAVDAVHFLDASIGSAIRATNLYFILQTFIANAIPTNLATPDRSEQGYHSDYQNHCIIREHTSIRDVVKSVCNLFHQNGINTNILTNGNVWYSYVDGGIPTLYMYKPSSKWTINENDCGNVQRNVERQIKDFIVKHVALEYVSNSDAGTAELIKNVGTSLSFDQYSRWYSIGIGNDTRGDDIWGSKWTYTNMRNGVIPMVPTNESGCADAYLDGGSGFNRLQSPNLSMSDLAAVPPNPSQDEAYCNFVPWNAPYDSEDDSWYQDGPGRTIRSLANALTLIKDTGIISSTDDPVELQIRGAVYKENAETNIYTDNRDGVSEDMEAPMLGDFSIVKRSGSTVIAQQKIYPSRAYNSLFDRSNITGSFTWKGDPRMQPRDVFTFHRLDGTTEDCTLENITITHEKGGTSAEITYRKGIC